MQPKPILLSTLLIVALTNQSGAGPTDEGTVGSDRPTLTYMYKFSTSYLLSAINEQLDVEIEFFEMGQPSNWIDKERTLLASGDLPDVMSLRTLSPFDQLQKGLSRAIPEETIRENMPGYSRILDTSSGWSVLKNPVEDATQLGFTGYRYDNKYDQYQIAMRRHLTNNRFDQLSESTPLRGVPNFSVYGSRDETITIDTIEAALSYLERAGHSFWIGSTLDLAPLFALFGLHTVQGSVLFGYDRDTYESNFDSGRLREFLDRLHSWQNKGYIHESSFALLSDDSDVGARTVLASSYGRRPDWRDAESLPAPLSWVREENSDVVVLGASNIVARPTEHLFVGNETLNARILEDQLIGAARVFEHVRVLLDGLTGPRYWVEWVYGKAGIHYSTVNGVYVPERVDAVTDPDYSKFLEGRQGHQFANWHFKIWPIFGTQDTAEDEYDDVFIDYMEDYAPGWEGVPAFWAADVCGTTEDEINGYRGDADVLASIVRGQSPTEHEDLLGRIEDHVRNALAKCS